MIYEYSRINLKQTNYSKTSNARLGTAYDYDELMDIYRKYCEHKQFASVMPIFREDLRDNDVMCYYQNDELVAWSLLICYPSANSVTAEQFAWDYADPTLRLGIRSLEHECAFYKQLGYDYLYLHGADDYKSKFDGYEILGPA